MKTLLLNGSWSLDIPAKNLCNVPAAVPGSVYNDLLTAQLMPDPFYRDNEMIALKLMDNDFYYSRCFQVDEALYGSDAPISPLSLRESTNIASSITTSVE